MYRKSGTYIIYLRDQVQSLLLMQVEPIKVYFFILGDS